MSKPGYREQGKKRANKAKHGFAINQEQMEYERRKLLEEMSHKVDRRKLNNMAAVAATKEPKYLDEEGNEKELVLRERVHGPWTEEEENQKAKNGCLLHESEGFLL